MRGRGNQRAMVRRSPSGGEDPSRVVIAVATMFENIIPT